MGLRVNRAARIFAFEILKYFYVSDCGVKGVHESYATLNAMYEDT